jgi:predicted TIM-barrel fold metal-dependent hydrolase
MFVPLEKLFFGTDYPGFLYDPVLLRDKLLSVNEEAAACSMPPIPEDTLNGIMGTNLAKVLSLEDDSSRDA